MTHTDDGIEDFALGDSLDNAILMHRDAHFGGNFDIMIDYYENEGKGVMPEFELSRIQELALLEKEMPGNLAGLLLSGPEAEKVQRAREAYKALRDLYNTSPTKSPYPRLLADLILAEEEDPKEQIDAIVTKKAAIVPFLIDLLRSDDFHDPLFPGYGLAPVYAARCLGDIGDKSALISLFEEIGESDFFNDDNTILALKAIGEPAKEFLLKILRAKPINYDNERAAIALTAFKEDPQVAEACLALLCDHHIWQDPQLTTYLILGCEHLQNSSDRQRLIELAKDPRFPPLLKPDITLISNAWHN